MRFAAEMGFGQQLLICYHKNPLTLPLPLKGERIKVRG